jgi:hypothetical protein
MARDDTEEGKVTIRAAGEERGGCIVRFLVTTLVLGIILLVGLLFVVRTEGGRQLAAGMVGKRLGLEMNVGVARIGLPYDLVMEDVVSIEALPGGEPLVSIKELRVGLGSTLRVRVHHCVLNLIRQEDEAWLPGSMARLGDLPMKNVAEISRLTAGFRKRVSLRVTDLSVRWLNSKGQPMATAGGVTFNMEPTQLPDRRMYHYHLSIYHVLGPAEAKVHDVEREWLAAEGMDYVEIGRSGRQTSLSQRGFWETEK